MEEDEQQHQEACRLLPFQDTQLGYVAMDWLGRPAHARLGGWKCASLVLGAITLCFMASYGILFNLVVFLTEQGENNAAAATTVTTLSGTQLLFSFLGALLSDTYLGRLRSAIFFQMLSTLCYILVGVSVVVVVATGAAKLFLFVSLYMTVITTGLVLPNLLGIGVDQLNINEDKEKYFQLTAIAILLGQLLATTLVSYFDTVGMWVWGFWSSTIASFTSLSLIAAGLRWFRQHKVSGNPFVRSFKVLFSALRKHRLPLPADSTLLHECQDDIPTTLGCRRLPHTCTLSFLDKAAVVKVGDTSKDWHLCTVSQVEELKTLLRVMPAGVSITFTTVAVTQISTLVEEQAMKMNRHLGAWFVAPPASLNALTLVLGVSLLCSMIAMVIAALVESHRLHVAQKGGFISVVWLVPQSLLLGAALNIIASSSLDFFYTEMSESMRSLAGCLSIIFFGAGSYLNSIFIALITAISTRGGQPGWIADNLDEGHADYYYWFLAFCIALALALHIAYATAYRYRGS